MNEGVSAGDDLSERPAQHTGCPGSRPGLDLTRHPSRSDTFLRRTHVAPASGHLGHTVQKRIPTVDPPLAARGQRAPSTAKSPCSVLF